MYANYMQINHEEKDLSEKNTIKGNPNKTSVGNFYHTSIAYSTTLRNAL